MNSEKYDEVMRLIDEEIKKGNVIRISKPFLFALNGNVQQATLLTYLVEKNAKNFGNEVYATFSEIEDKLLIEREDVMDAIISFGEKMWLRQFTITGESIEVSLYLEKIARDVGGINGRR